MNEASPRISAANTSRRRVLHRYVDSSRTATFALIASCVIWGTAFFFGKVALRQLSE